MLFEILLNIASALCDKSYQFGDWNHRVFRGTIIGLKNPKTTSLSGKVEMDNAYVVN